MFLETGQKPSRGKLYLETHKKKDGSIVNDAAKGIVEQIEVGLTQSNVDESVISPNDVVGRVLGPEHSGRVRCMAAFKAYLMMKEGGIPQEVADILGLSNPHVASGSRAGSNIR
ncbi:hypothetical protein P8452_18190 [Trifolium repens]|nr:hypothetical protein P8452_18190 [Trifolium repens]